MFKKRLLFVYNPQSGRGLVKENLPAILDVFSASGYEVIVHATLARMDAAEVVEDYIKNSRLDLVVCAGGDGTLDEVAGAVMKSGGKVPIGIISAGSTNDFGYSLGIPQDLTEAAEVAINGKEFVCDIASFNGQFFSYTAAFGLFSDVSYDTPQNMKNAIGHAAYVLHGMMKLASMRKYHAKVLYDDGEIEDDFLLGMVVSSNSVGGFRGITGEGVKLDDGKHELMLVRAPKHIGDLSKAVNEVLSHATDGKYFIYLRTAKATFFFDEEVPWSLDGEYGGKGIIAQIEVIHNGITYMVPDDSPVTVNEEESEIQE